MQPLENSLCQSISKWVPFSNLRRVRQEKETEGLRLSFAVPRYSGALTPTAPWAIRLWDTFTF